MSDSPRKQVDTGQSVIRLVFLVAATAAGCMFLNKLFQFWSTNLKGDLAGFGGKPIVVYLLVAAGFLFLLAWAFLTGQFRDVEGPKYDLFDKYNEQVRAEAAARHDS